MRKFEEVYNIFYFDTETTGCAGMSTYDKSNRLLQVCAMGEDNSLFNKLANPQLQETQKIPPLSSQTHRIYDMNVVNKRSSDEVAEEFAKWVTDKAAKDPKKRQILMVAHNAPFDKAVIFKHLRNATYGENCELLKWEFLDTLIAFKKFYPEIEEECLPVQAPFRLENLFKRLFPDESGFLGHNAETDIRILKKLTEEKLFERCYEKELKLEKCFISNKYTDPLNVKIIDLKGYPEFIVQKIVTEVNETLEAADLTELLTNTELITVGHLLVYGRTKQLAQVNDLNYEDDECFNTLKAIESFFRQSLKRYNDGYLLEILSLVINTTPVELMYHTRKNSGDTIYFPTTSGTPTAYLPLSISKNSAKNLKEIGINSYHELYNQWCLAKNRYTFVEYISSHLTNGDFISVEFLSNSFNTNLLYKK